MEIVLGNIFRKTLESWVLDPGLFQFIILPNLMKHQLWWAFSLLVFWKCTLRQSKNGIIINQKLTGRIILLFYQNYKRAWNWFSVFTIGINKSCKMYVISCTKTWQNFILILPRTLKKQLKVQHLKYLHVYVDITEFEVSAFIKSTKI